MINRRLVLVPSHFHFSQWEIREYEKYFVEVRETRKHRAIRAQDIILVHSWNWMNRFADVKCAARFGFLFPGFGFQPWMLSDHVEQGYKLLEKYTAFLTNKGPVWERMKQYPRVHLAPHSAADKAFKKTRKRDVFKRIIQVARNDFYKGRHITESVARLLPYKCDLYPRATLRGGAPVSRGYHRPWESLPCLYQEADGFLSPNMVGLEPGYEVDAKYNQATMEAGLSGCLIFWHDIMNTGNDFETVFPISLVPEEIAQKIKEAASSIDVEVHSTQTAQEFYENCNAARAVKAKVGIMKEYL